MKRTLTKSLAVVILLGGALVAPASPAQADVLDITCLARSRTTYAPGVTFTPSLQSIHVRTRTTDCVSVSRPRIRSSISDITFPGVRSCLDIDQTVAGTSAITWNTGKTSVYEYSSTTATVAGQIVATIRGRVVSGPFRNGMVTIVTLSPVVNLLQCLAPPGITERFGVGSLTITNS